MPSSDSSSDEDVAKFAAVAVSADALHQQAERSKQASALGVDACPSPPPPLCRRRLGAALRMRLLPPLRHVIYFA